MSPSRRTSFSLAAAFLGTVLMAALWLALAAAPAPAETIGPQVRVSQMGPDGDTDYGVDSGGVAYNSAANEYLVVWESDDNTPPLVPNEDEIFGRRIDAAGNPIGGQFRISDMGPNGDTNYSGGDPAVTYNAATNQYLVVWEGDDNTAPLVENEFEIFGQLLTAAGTETGPNDFRLSDMGPNGDDSYSAGDAAVAYDAAVNEYLVVWEGDDNTPPLTDDETEVFGQRVTAAGAETGANDFRLSDAGPNGDDNYNAQDPAIAGNPATNEYLVVWEADDNTPPFVDNEFEIYGQRVSGAGAEVGSNDFRVSTTGPSGDMDYDGQDPAIAYGSGANEYLAAWEADKTIDGDRDIYGQRIGAGGEVGPDDFRISAMGPDGSVAYSGGDPAAAYDSHANEYQVSWEGDDNTPPLSNNAFEIFGQRVTAAGAETGTDDFQISQIGPNGNTANSFDPGSAFNSSTNQFLTAWEGDDNTPPLVDDEYEIFARRSEVPPPAGPGADTKAPGLKLSGSKSQRALKKRVLVVFATCDEACTITATAGLSVPKASKTFKLKKVSKSLTAGKRTKLSIRISKKTAKAAKKALRKGKRVSATINLSASDAAGNTTKTKRKIKVKR